MVPVKTANVPEYMGYEYYRCTGSLFQFTYFPCNESYINSYSMEGEPLCENW